jgi:hypothetical protein
VGRLKPSLHRALAVGVLGVLGLLAVWLLHGGRLYVVETSSMGTRAPVGSLVAVSPSSVSQVRVGDVVTVRPSGRDAVWTHQVGAVNADGTISTRGQLSGPDPWRIGNAQLVGKARVFPRLGWLVKAAPLFIVGALITAVAVRRARRQLRLPLAIIGTTAALALAVVVYQPFQGADQLQLTAQDGGAVGSWVNTGLLPLRLTPLSGAQAQVIASGELAHFRFAHAAPGGRYGVRLSPQVPWQLWVLMVGGCLLPAMVETARRHSFDRTSTNGRRLATWG